MRRPYAWLRAALFVPLLLAVAAATARADATALAAARADATVLDDFENISGWSARASEGAKVWVVQEAGPTGNGIRIGFDLNSAGGYVLVHKAINVALPPNFAFTFQLRGEGRPNNFEFKLIDPSGKNVWWRNQRDFTFPTTWQREVIRKSRIDFAWGPQRGEPKQVGAIEFAISAGEGGSGSIWIDDLALEPREAAAHDGPPPAVTASTALPGHDPALVLDNDGDTSWTSEAIPTEQWLVLDFHRNQEYGGLVLDWEPQDYATSYVVQWSNDGREWTTAYETSTAKGGRDYVYMPDAESRYLRLFLRDSSRGQGYGLRTLAVKPVEFSASPNQFFEAIAADAPIGTYPKYLYGKQTYWTVVGVDGDGKEALLNEEGTLEVDKASFSIEPYLYANGKLITWNAVETHHELEEGTLPIPSVTWKTDHLTLRVTAFASGQPGASTLYARYRVESQGEKSEPVRLYLAIRPFQVNPPWQSITMTGGVSRIQELRLDGRVAWVNRHKAVVAMTPPTTFGAATFEEGSVTEFLLHDRLPPSREVIDEFGFASGAFRWDLTLEPKTPQEIDVAVPFHDPVVGPVAGFSAQDARAFVSAEQEVTRRTWRTILDRVEIDLPPEARKLVETVQTTLAYILINRDGPALQPGSRNYARSWIRDGAITSSALLQLGCPEQVREYLRWFVRYQGADGRVPCCVDKRGPDPVAENDSPGEFIWAVSEYYRYTRDVGFLHDMWPHVTRAVDYLTTIRNTRMTDEYKTGEKEAFFGLLPESISHEGYAAHPVHSYWDDFFALRGLKDAAALAQVVGDTEHAEKFATLRDGFRQTLYASIARTVATHDIDYVPGSAELGDFDPTSTSIALVPGGELEHLPAGPLARTYERYWEDVQSRQTGEAWEAYTPYEVRNVGALLRLGARDRALALLDWMVADQRPPEWNEWAEVSWRDPQLPRFIGDMPHTWVGAGFIHAVRSLLVYERETDGALVLGAGVPPAWLASEHGVGVKRLPTHWGILHYQLRADGPDTLKLHLSGDMTMPPGKFVLVSPYDRPIRSATVNGRALDAVSPDSVRIDEFPADVVVQYAAQAVEQRVDPGVHG